MKKGKREGIMFTEYWHSENCHQLFQSRGPHSCFVHFLKCTYHLHLTGQDTRTVGSQKTLQGFFLSQRKQSSLWPVKPDMAWLLFPHVLCVSAPQCCSYSKVHAFVTAPPAHFTWGRHPLISTTQLLHSSMFLFWFFGGTVF
jgi:hypothetical protein